MNYDNITWRFELHQEPEKRLDPFSQTDGDIAVFGQFHFFYEGEQLMEYVSACKYESTLHTDSWDQIWLYHRGSSHQFLDSYLVRKVDELRQYAWKVFSESQQEENAGKVYNAYTNTWSWL